MRIGGPELVVIVLVFAVLFGGAKIPAIAKGFGDGIRNFKKSVKDESSSHTEK